MKINGVLSVVIPRRWVSANVSCVRQLRALCAVLLSFYLSCGQALADEQFKNYEVRVIKNKYFQKSFRLELSGETTAIMNRAFVNTMLAGAHMGFHFTESIGLFGEGHYGFTFKKSDCETLGTTFAIEPLLDNLTWWAGGGLTYTPIYGKYQLSSGRVVYFDWLFSAGMGVAQIEHKENGTCSPNPDTSPEAQAKNFNKSRLVLNFGTGQRFFLNDSVSLNWNLRFLIVQPTFEEGLASFSHGVSNILLNLGASYFL